jgi:hypothetical protein
VEVGRKRILSTDRMREARDAGSQSGTVGGPCSLPAVVKDLPQGRGGV